MANDEQRTIEHNLLREVDGSTPQVKAVPNLSPSHVSVSYRPSSGRKRAWLIGLAAPLAIVALVFAVPGTRWRAQLLFLDLTGQISAMGPGELIPLLMPGAGQPQIARLVITRNPYAVIHVPSTIGEADISAGAALFRDQCATCHAPDGSGGPGAPPLYGREFKHGDSEWSIYRTIKFGVPNTGMQPHPLARSQLWQLVAYIRSLGVAASSEEASPEVAEKAKSIDVAPEELAAISEPGGDWLTYSGSYTSTRHSALTQINTQNVNQLAIRWINQIDDPPGKIECSPLVRDGMMFVTAPRARVMALDAATGRRLWLHYHPYEMKGGGEGPLEQNRGVALLNDRVFVGSWDSRLAALSAATGKILWETTVGEYPGTYISSAPLAFRDLVVTGVGTGSGGNRGFLVAYDVNTGRQRWQFKAIPEPGERGHETWAGDSWKTGGTGTWMTGSYDPQADVLYWGIGNPKPDFVPAARKGDNLYSDSVVALRGTTGELLWHFQFTPADDHDWDSEQVPLIADRKTDQGTEKRLLWANRNGFYYVLDRETGAFKRGVPFVRQNWAEGLDAKGRPIRATLPTDSVQGHPVYPGSQGGTNWWPPTFDPQLDLIFVPALEQGMMFFPSEKTLPTTAGRSFYTAVRALDASTGALVWEHRQETRLGEARAAGLISTRGGVVFGGDQSTFFALEARTGRLLWSVETGGLINAAPVTYTVSGEQFVTIIAGRNVLTFALPKPPAGDATVDSS